MAERIGWRVVDNGDCTYDGDDFETKTRRVAAFRDWLAVDTQLSYTEHSREIIRSTESVHVKRAESSDPYLEVKNVDVIARGCHAVYKEVLDAAQNGEFALTVGGDHSIAAATIAATLKAYPDLAVIWIDAHADANTPDTSPSNHYHGMPAAHLMGWFKKPLPGFEWLQSVLQEGRLAYVGLRDIDPAEGRMLQESGAHVFTMAQVDRLGIAQVMALAIEKVDPYHRRPLHLTFDIDAIDPVFAPGTGTLARGGLTYRESHYICEEMSATNRLVAMDLVEVNPLVDIRPRESMHGDDPDLAATTTTVSFALELCFSCLGKNILNSTPKDHAILSKAAPVMMAIN